LRDDLRGVIDEVITLSDRLRWIHDRMHEEDGLSNARRGILRGLVQFGAQTVPNLARARSVSRQHVQGLIDALVDDKLVEVLPNPAHRRSPLIQVTAAGEKCVRKMDDANRRVVVALGADMPARELAVTARTLRAVRAAFEIELRWRSALER
jgi:DNA-binding MarR family transcriptional regulator